MGTSFDDREQISPAFFEPLFNALSFCNKALSELNLMENIIHTDEETEILNNYTFDFYKLSVRYCFNNEYCKIFSSQNANQPGNLSSLLQINNHLFQRLGSAFESTFNNNANLLFSIIETDFYKNQMLLKQVNEVVSMINQLNYKDVQTAFQHLIVAAEVIANFTSFFDLEHHISIPNINTSTIDFVMDHSVFKKFYVDNHLKAFD